MSPRVIAVGGILAVLVGTTLTSGGVEAGPRASFLAGAIACLLAAAWDARGDDLTRPVRAVALPVVLIIAWGLLQTVPLPAGFLALVAPKTASLYAQTVPEGRGRSLPVFLARQSVNAGVSLIPGGTIPDGPDDRGVVGLGRTLSIAPWETRSACLAWLSPLLLFVAAALCAMDLRARSWLLWGIAAWGACLGALAVLQRVTGRNSFVPSGGIPPDSQPLGPFINPNHLAAYVAIAALVGLGLTLAHVQRSFDRVSWSTIRAALVEVEWTLPRVLTLSAFTTLSIVGLALSRSRGGWLGFAAGLSAIALGRRRPGWLAGVVAAVAFVGIGVGVASWVGGRGAGTEMIPFAMHQQDASGAERIDAWAKCIALTLDHPVAGTGLGTFRWAFPAYQRLGEWMIWKQAHNDYLQFLTEAGLVGGFVFVFGLVLIARRAVVPALSGGRAGPRWTTFGAFAAVVAISVHSIVDFSLQIPAVAALFATVLGILAAAASDRQRENA